MPRDHHRHPNPHRSTPAGGEQRGASSQQARRTIAIASLAMSLSFVAQTMLLLVVPLFALTLGASPATIGLLVAAPFVGPMFFSIPMGRLVTMFGARRMMSAGAIGMALGPLAALLSPTLLGLLVMQLVIGTLQVVMGLAAQSTIATLGRGPRSESAFGWYSTIVSAGQMVGPISAGALLDTLGAPAVFATAAFIPVLAWLLALALQAPPGIGGSLRGAPLGYREQLQLLRVNPAVQVSMLLTTAVLFSFGSHAAFFPVYLESLSVSASLIGALLSIRALTSMLIRPFMAQVIAALGGRARTVLTTIGLMALGVGLTGLFNQIAVLALLAVIIGVAVGLAQPLSIVTITDHVGALERPSALGLRLSANQAAQVVGPLALGLVAESFGFPAMFAVGGVALLAMLVWMQRVMPAYRSLEGTLAGRLE
jgi:MFS family permease